MILLNNNDKIFAYKYLINKSNTHVVLIALRPNSQNVTLDLVSLCDKIFLFLLKSRYGEV